MDQFEYSWNTQFELLHLLTFRDKDTLFRSRGLSSFSSQTRE